LPHILDFGLFAFINGPYYSRFNESFTIFKKNEEKWESLARKYDEKTDKD
jgi:hypothetical protein